MFYLQTLFFSICGNVEFHPLRWNQVKNNLKKKKFHFFPPKDTYFLSVGKKNVQKISFARIICPSFDGVKSKKQNKTKQTKYSGGFVFQRFGIIFPTYIYIYIKMHKIK